MVDDKILFIIDKDREFFFDGSTFQKVSTKKLKNYYSAAVLPYSNIYTNGFKISKNSTSEKIDVQAEMKIYEDRGLDLEVDFSISSLEIPLENSDENYVETYAAEISKIDENFKEIVKQHSYIDLIFPPALSYSSLYPYELLDKKNDLFIHFGDKDSYAVIFKDGEYISTRTIASLEEMGKKIEVDAVKMREILSTKGVKDELYSDSEFLQMSDTQEQLSKIVERIAHAISHKRGVFKLEAIDRIFLDFEGSDIPGFLDLFDGYGYENSSKQILDIFKSVESGMKHFAINALYALSCVQNRQKPVNLTIYERKLPFLKTQIGHFSMVIFLTLLLCSVYPIYATFVLQELNNKQDRLTEEFSKIQLATKKLQNNLKKEREKRDSLKTVKNDKNLQTKTYEAILNSLEKFDSYQISRQKIMKDINLAMKRYNLSSKKLEYKDSNYVIVQLIATTDKRDNIAKFMKKLISLGYSDVKTKKIEKNKTYYESFVEVHP